MGKLRIKRAFVLFAMVIVVAIPLFQLFHEFSAKEEKQDASYLLFQVSLFQMELLSSFLNESAKAKETEELNALKQAAYSANYTHERVVLALGSGSLTDLLSIPQLMQYILRLQIGGMRPLKADELQQLQETGKLFKTLYEDYAKLLSAHSTSVISSQNEKVRKTDRAISEMLRKKLLK